MAPNKSENPAQGWITTSFCQSATCQQITIQKGAVWIRSSLQPESIIGIPVALYRQYEYLATSDQLSIETMQNGGQVEIAVPGVEPKLCIFLDTGSKRVVFDYDGGSLNFTASEWKEFCDSASDRLSFRELIKVLNKEAAAANGEVASTMYMSDLQIG